MLQQIQLIGTGKYWRNLDETRQEADKFLLKAPFDLRIGGGFVFQHIPTWILPSPLKGSYKTI